MTVLVSLHVTSLLNTANACTYTSCLCITLARRRKQLKSANRRIYDKGKECSLKFNLRVIKVPLTQKLLLSNLKDRLKLCSKLFYSFFVHLFRWWDTSVCLRSDCNYLTFMHNVTKKALVLSWLPTNDFHKHCVFY